MLAGCWVLGAGSGQEKINRIRESRMREMKRVYEARAENIAKGHGQVCVPLPHRATVLRGWVGRRLHGLGLDLFFEKKLPESHARNNTHQIPFFCCCSAVRLYYKRVKVVAITAAAV